LVSLLACGLRISAPSAVPSHRLPITPGRLVDTHPTDEAVADPCRGFPSGCAAAEVK
jgi:hypothetical protein